MKNQLLFIDHPQSHCFLLLFKNFHVTIITTPPLCDYSLLFVSSKIDVNKNFKDSFNGTMSFIHIPFFHSFTRYFYLSKEIFADKTTSYCSLSGNGNHE